MKAKEKEIAAQLVTPHTWRGGAEQKNAAFPLFVLLDKIKQPQKGTHTCRMAKIEEKTPYVVLFVVVLAHTTRGMFFCREKQAKNLFFSHFTKR